MKKFKCSKEYTQILNECSKVKILNEECVFECYDQNMFTYSINKNNTYHEFTFVCEDTLIKYLTVQELLLLKNIKYFSHKIWLTDTNGDLEQIGEKIYHCLSDINLN